jgi:hypothetical protein
VAVGGVVEALGEVLDAATHHTQREGAADVVEDAVGARLAGRCPTWPPSMSIASDGWVGLDVYALEGATVAEVMGSKGSVQWRCEIAWG